ncbi:MAG: HAMP domain-containing sensor histidine kinase [Lachnospiraceae bacterium]|nr:HAMP domain-containing sensor histidine kinase [Lachnospiraceae bacterium]
MSKLRSRLIKIVLLCVVGVFLLMALILHLSLSFHNIRQADLMTQIICDNNGIVPPFEDDPIRFHSYPMGFSEESPYRTRYFIVYVNQNMQVLDIDRNHIASVTEEDAVSMAERVLESEKKVGFEGKYRYRISSSEGTIQYIVFLDYSESRSAVESYLRNMGVVFLGFTLLISVVFVICSKFVLKPFEENSRRQKQFVTDASHDLKTPLAVISANAQVLEYKNGKNEWTQAIREEIKHMGELIDDLLTLSKLEEAEQTLPMEAVDFSQIVLEVTEKFHEVIMKKDCSFQVTVQPGIKVYGNQEQLLRLVSVLMENGAKYVTENGRVEAELYASGRTVNLKIFNTAVLAEDFECSKLFERFYRADNSRSSSTGGHGIGLSIAKRIADSHNGTIRASKKEDGILFFVSLPRSSKEKKE